MRKNTQDYRTLFLTGTPLLDLRAPCEFNKGAFPNTINLPLMTDIERQKVGTSYKRDGQAEAIKLGHQLVKGEIKAERLAAWKKFTESYPDSGYLYCFRGGLRSRTVQQWLLDEGISFPMVQGGYKALRRFLIESCEQIATAKPFYILSGLTGTAKTVLLKQLKYAIDLEGLANHRGSSFGRQITPQPSQIAFENQLAIEMLKMDSENNHYFILEDESRLIGSRATPLSFYNKMSQAPLIMLHESFDFRVNHIYQEYVVNMTALFTQSNLKLPFEAFSDYLLESIDKIKKRLGNEAHNALRGKIVKALAVQRKTTSQDLHFDWITQLLRDYYDPMYNFQLKKKRRRIIFEGSAAEIKAYVDSIKF